MGFDEKKPIKNYKEGKEKSEYIRLADMAIPIIIDKIREKQRIFERLTGIRYPYVFEFDGKCGAGKTSAHRILAQIGEHLGVKVETVRSNVEGLPVDTSEGNYTFNTLQVAAYLITDQEQEVDSLSQNGGGVITTDDHNEDADTSKACFAKKSRLVDRKINLLAKKTNKCLSDDEQAELQGLDNQIALAGDEGAFKLELIKWLRIYDRLIYRIQGEKVNSGDIPKEMIEVLSRVYSTRGVITLIAHTFARQARDQISFPQEVAQWMLELLDSGVIPLPMLFGYISTGSVEVTQTRITQRHSVRKRGCELRRQEEDLTAQYLREIQSTTLYNRGDQTIHKAVLELLLDIMMEQGTSLGFLDSGNVSPECIARGIVRSSEILSYNTDNAQVVSQVFRSFLEKVATGDINLQTILSRIQNETEQEEIRRVTALEYFESHHNNDYGFDWEEFESMELMTQTGEYYEQFHLQQEFLETEVEKGLDVVIPFRNGSIDNLRRTLMNLGRSFDNLLSYMAPERRGLAKLNIIIVDQESNLPIRIKVDSGRINNKNISVRIIKAQKHPCYEFDVDACRAEGIKHAELGNVLFLDHEVFLHPQTLTRFYKTMAKTKLVKGPNAIACCSSTVDKVTQAQLDLVLNALEQGRIIKVTLDWLLRDRLLESTEYLRKLGGSWSDNYGIRPVYGFMRPGIHLLPTQISRHAFGITIPMGGYGKEQIKYLQSFVEHNGRIFVIIDPNRDSPVYTIKEENLVSHNKALDKEKSLRQNAEYELTQLGRIVVRLIKDKDGSLRYEVI